MFCKQIAKGNSLAKEENVSNGVKIILLAKKLNIMSFFGIGGCHANEKKIGPQLAIQQLHHIT